MDPDPYRDDRLFLKGQLHFYTAINRLDRTVENAQREISFFFPERQIYSRNKKVTKNKLETAA